MRDWPATARLDASVYFADAGKAWATFKILDPKGRPLYILKCLAPTPGMVDDTDFDYSGAFHCRLTSTYAKERYSTLLADNPHPTRDWETRGRVLADELVGKCADYPEYGRIRHFRLRKMRITLSFDRLSFKPSLSTDGQTVKSAHLESFAFSVKVEPDPTALSSIAEPVGVSYPPRAHPRDPNDLTLNCEVVVPQHVPR